MLYPLVSVNTYRMPLDPRSPWRTPEQRAEEREAKREAVLRTAARLFNERGFSAASLDEVAARLKVTKPIIYRHFANKDQILFECVRMALGQILEAAAAAKTGPGKARDRLMALMTRYAVIMTEDFGMCVVRTGDHELSEASRKEFRKLKRKIDRLIRSLIQEGVADGSIARCDVKMTSFAIAGALNWIAKWYSPDGAESAEEVAGAMVALLQGLLTRRA
ncbi:MAG TPA: TetR/AcrR family transcriptional regulator [Polyangiaceae bacterium]|nr:TetR/AcrR family transcriptional regulator [Polyangiaceae bacterium]